MSSTKSQLAACGASIDYRYLLCILKGPENVCLFMSARVQQDMDEVLPPMTKPFLWTSVLPTCLWQPGAGREESLAVPHLWLRSSGQKSYCWIAFQWHTALFVAVLDVCFSTTGRKALLNHKNMSSVPCQPGGKPHCSWPIVVRSNHLRSHSPLLLFISQNCDKSWCEEHGLFLKT